MGYKLNRFLKWAGLLALVLLAAYLLHRCNNSEPSIATQRITIQEQKGGFEAKEVKNVPVSQKPTRQKLSNPVTEKISNTENAFLQSQIDKLLAGNKKQFEEFAKANDSLKKLLYTKAIELNEFSQTFDDDKVKIDVSGVAQGLVKSMKIDYTIKPLTIEVPVKQKERVFALRVGGEYGNSLELDKGVFKGNLEFENRKRLSYNIGFDTDRRIWAGGKITIFEMKR